jgi:hypothetical protein
MTFTADLQEQTNNLSTEFNWEIYTQCNSEVEHLSDYDSAYQHWIEEKKHRKVIATEEQFYKLHKFEKSNLPVDFDWQEYLDVNSDIKSKYPHKKWLILRHFFRYGFKEKRAYSFQKLGEKMLEHKQYKNAINPFKRAIELEKQRQDSDRSNSNKNLESYLILVNALINNNLLEEAKKFYQYLLESYADRLTAIEQIKSGVGSTNLELLNNLVNSQETSAIDKFSAQKENQINIPTETTQIYNPDNIKLIAYYLPQFHPIAENDEWWGKGFTEWTNVSKAKSLFEGHYQPRQPRELGYYDLRLAEIRKQQAELAKKYGIYGFCYYYYWFAGRRILERPLQEILESQEPDFPFCICWANESWSRRWDGSENEVLIQQKHDEETDAAFIEDVIPILKDKRYIKIDNAPILIVYRINMFPNPIKTADIWRKACQKAGIEKIHLVAVETHGCGDPRSFGFDAACEFPPHKLQASLINKNIQDLPPNFTGKIYDYEEAVFNSLRQPTESYEKYHGVMTSWDNTPRRGPAGNIFHGATPDKFETWFNGIAEKTVAELPIDRRLVFVNAWNEWAESAHLEPDQKWGTQYLESVRRVITKKSSWQSDLKLLSTLTDSRLFTSNKVIARLENRFLSLERSIKFLQNLDIVQELTMSTSIASNIPPEEFALNKISGEAVGHIDRINQHESSTTLTISKQDSNSMYVSGWFFTKHKEDSPLRPLWLVLKDKTENLWFGQIYQRYTRRDLSQYFSEEKELNILEAGFKAYMKLDMLPAGAYKLLLVSEHEDGFSLLETNRGINLV